MSAPASPLPEDWSARDLAELDRLLAAVPAPLESLDPSLLDGYLCGVLLQPHTVPEAMWLAHVIDTEGRPLPAGFALEPLRQQVRRRYAQLDAAIATRQWFDPWIFQDSEEVDDDDALALVLPWCAGFAMALDLFPTLMDEAEDEALEGLALIYRAFDPDDLEDADDLLAVIQEVGEPDSAEEAVEDLVTAVMLLADQTRPAVQPVRPAARPAVAPPAPARRAAAPAPVPRRPAPAAPAGRPGARPSSGGPARGPARGQGGAAPRAAGGGTGRSGGSGGSGGPRPAGPARKGGKAKP
ncbi:YecA/YgfB family protein [Ideonella livida]|uniref:YecA family protein n=1 Tax=Ideonella livida TaxID=2707176 RepID=A0A7C9TKN0_9BURK|nr:YecA family protein [Ideonella livida]NDY92939.1 YecA family protein [Ideonella livida]